MAGVRGRLCKGLGAGFAAQFPRQRLQRVKVPPFVVGVAQRAREQHAAHHDVEARDRAISGKAFERFDIRALPFAIPPPAACLFANVEHGRAHFV